jgi:hypothetical protein
MTTVRLVMDCGPIPSPLVVTTNRSSSLERYTETTLTPVRTGNPNRPTYRWK